MSRLPWEHQGQLARTPTILKGGVSRGQDTALPLIDSGVANIQCRAFLGFKLAGHPDLERFTRKAIEYKQSARLRSEHRSEFIAPGATSDHAVQMVC